MTIENRVTEYLAAGGLFNPEYMDHAEVHDLLIDAKVEIERLKDKCDKQAKILRRMAPDKYPEYFIHSGLGKIDNNGMPEKLLVCPAYGLDFSYIYEWTGKSTGCEW